MKSKLYYDLLDIIEKQDEMMCKQNKLMAKLVNENIEKENMIWKCRSCKCKAFLM